MRRSFRPGGHSDAALITATCVGIVAFSSRSLHRHAARRALLHRHVGLVRLVRDRQKVLALRPLLLRSRGHPRQRPHRTSPALAIILLRRPPSRVVSPPPQPSGSPASFFTSRWSSPGTSPSKGAIPPSTSSSSSSTIWNGFATNRYQHHQPFWYYWASSSSASCHGPLPLSAPSSIPSVSPSPSWKVRHNPQRYLGHTRAGDAFPEFLVLWALFPIIFSPAPNSRLHPSLHSAPHHLRGRLPQPHAPLRLAQVADLVPCRHLRHPCLRPRPRAPAQEARDPRPSAQWLLSAAAGAIAIGITVFSHHPALGNRSLQRQLLIPVFAALIFLLGFYGKELDLNYSARPSLREIERRAPGLKLPAIPGVKRDMDYGLAFYRNESLIHYKAGTASPPANISSSFAPATPTSSITGPQAASTSCYSLLRLSGPRGLPRLRPAVINPRAAFLVCHPVGICPCRCLGRCRRLGRCLFYVVILNGGRIPYLLLLLPLPVLKPQNPVSIRHPQPQSFPPHCRLL